MSHPSERIYPITRGDRENYPLLVLRDSNDNNNIFAIGKPTGADVKNTFANEEKPRTKNAEKKMFKEEGLDDNNIDPKAFYKGGVAHKKRSKRRHTTRKKNKRRSSKKQKSRRRYKKSKSKHTK